MYKKVLSVLYNAAKEKLTKITVVAIKAVAIMLKIKHKQY